MLSNEEFSALEVSRQVLVCEVKGTFACAVECLNKFAHLTVPLRTGLSELEQGVDHEGGNFGVVDHRHIVEHSVIVPVFAVQ